MEKTAYSLHSITEMEPMFRRNFVNCLSGFKSVNLIGTVSKAGLTNLAIFSQVFHIGASPPLMGVLVRPDSVDRHTLRNMRETGFFTLNHIRPEFYQAAHQTSARYEESEFEATGLTPCFNASFPAPFVQESPLQVGLKVAEEHTLTINGTHLIIGSAECVLLPSDAVGKDGFIDLKKLGSITCSGLDSYHTTQLLGRLPYAKPGKAPALLNDPTALPENDAQS